MNNTPRITRLLGTGLVLAGLGLSVSAGASPAAAAAVVAVTTARPAAASSSAGIEFKLSQSNGLYTVFMRPSVTPADPNATSSAQVTVKAPHGLLSPSDLTSLVPGTVWTLTSRQDAPPEAPNSDYLSFSLDFPNGDVKAFNWTAATELPLFSFKASPGAHLMDTCDAFAFPNSRSASVGNEITVLGLGDSKSNVFLGNYGQSQDCPAPALAVSSVALSASSNVSKIEAGGLLTYLFKIKNSGLRTATALSLKLALSGVAEVRSTSNSLEVANPLLVTNGSATWQLGELAPGAEAVVTVVVIPLAREDDILKVSASIAATNDPTTASKDATVIVNVTQPQTQSGYRVHLPLIVR